MGDVGRALVKKKVFMLGSKDNDTINNSDINDTFKDHYLSEKELEEKLLQGIQLANGSKARVGAKKADGTGLEMTSHNQFHNILRHFDVLPNFLFITKETMDDYYL